jgi:cleavage and polyadenylation specificity factor subunit 1
MHCIVFDALFQCCVQAASVLTTSISLAGPGYLFLGSRLGNSLLLQFTSRELGQVGGRREREPPIKRKRLDMQGDWLDTELDEFEVYGSQETAAHRITAYSFQVCDSLLNIGPCGQVAMGEPAFLSEEFAASSPDPDIELVTPSGHGKNGALCLLQKTVRPQVVTELVQELKLDMLGGPVQVTKSYLTQCENPICRLPAMASALC